MKYIITILAIFCVAAVSKYRFGSPQENIEKVKTSKNEEEKFVNLEHLAISYSFVPLSELDVNEAKSYLKQLAAIQDNYKNRFNYGNSLHEYHIAMGRIFLKEGKVTESEEMLVKSCAGPGSPQLNAGWSNMVLAKELFEKGSRTKIKEFFKVCSKFLKVGSYFNLKEWQQAIDESRFPDVPPMMLNPYR